MSLLNHRKYDMSETELRALTPVTVYYGGDSSEDEDEEGYDPWQRTMDPAEALSLERKREKSIWSWFD